MATNAKHLAEVRAKKGRDFSPKWEGHETWDTNQFLRQFHSAMAWYRLESSAKELKPKVIDWMSRQGCTKEDIQWLGHNGDGSYLCRHCGDAV